MAPRATSTPEAPLTGRLTAVAIEAWDILGFQHVAIEPGQVTLIQGRNGSMKTSVLNAVHATLSGTSLARIARVDRDGKEVDPRAVLVLKSDEDEYRVEKRGDKTARVLKRVG